MSRDHLTRAALRCEAMPARPAALNSAISFSCLPGSSASLPRRMRRDERAISQSGRRQHPGSDGRRGRSGLKLNCEPINLPGGRLTRSATIDLDYLAPLSVGDLPELAHLGRSRLVERCHPQIGRNEMPFRSGTC